MMKSWSELPGSTIKDFEIRKNAQLVIHTNNGSITLRSENPYSFIYFYEQDLTDEPGAMIEFDEIKDVKIEQITVPFRVKEYRGDFKIEFILASDRAIYLKSEDAMSPISIV